MATQLFLQSTNADWWQDARAQNMIGSSSTRTAKKLATTRGGGVVSPVINTAQVFGGALAISPGAELRWISEPIDQDVTIASTITFNAWGLESSMSANATFCAKVSRLDNRGVAVSDLVGNFVKDNAELGTAAAAMNWTATPTSTAFQKGDRIMIAFGVADAPGVTMASGFTVTFSYAGGTAAANGDTYVTFTENFGFLTTAPAGSQYFFRDTAEATATGDPDFTSKQMSTTRGSSAVSKRSLVAGGTGAGSVSVPTVQFAGEPSLSNSGFRLPLSATNVDTVSGGNWVNPNNVLTDNGAVASVTTQAIGQHDELHLHWDLDDVFGRVVQAGARCECRQISATGFDTLRLNAVGGFAFGTLTSTLTLFTQDPVTAFTLGDGTAASLRTAGNQGYFHDDGTGSQGWTTEVDYVELKVYTQVVYEWFTPPLEAFTLAGLVQARLRGARATGFASPDGTLGLEVAVVDGNGTNPTVFGWGFSVTDTSTPVGTETSLECRAAGDDIAVTQGQRLRFRVVACAVYGDHYGNGFSNTDFFYDGPTADASGDSWIKLSQTVTEFTPAQASAPPLAHQRDRYAVAHR